MEITPPQPNTPALLPHKNFLARHVLAEALGVAVVVAVIAGAYYYQTSNTDSVFVAPVHHTQNATADWNTYTNSQYGFEFKYPPTLYNTYDAVPALLEYLPESRKYVGIAKNGPTEAWEGRVDI